MLRYIAATSRGFVTSAARRRTSGPNCWRRSTALSPIDASDEPCRTTSWPSFRKRSAIDRPIPRVDPVMRATGLTGSPSDRDFDAVITKGIKGLLEGVHVD